MSSASFPDSYARVLCIKQTVKFDQATIVDTAAPMRELLAQVEANPKLVLLKNHLLGINASDTNYVAGRYDARAKPPYPAGFESLATVVAVGSGVSSVRVGSFVGTMSYGAFSDYMVLHERAVFPIPALKPEYLGIMVNGLTAYLALHKAAGLKAGETVLVTGAVGATGQIAVQVAKAAGCHVIGTCGSDEKATQLKALGADRCVNYKTEDLATVLRKEYRKGVDVVFEGIGGKMLNDIVPNMAVRGRLLIIGAVSSYDNDGSFEDTWSDKIPTYLLLQKSASAVGFFLNHFVSDFPEAWGWLVRGVKSGTLQVGVDQTPFKGLEQVKEAVGHLQAGKNIGKQVKNISSYAEEEKVRKLFAHFGEIRSIYLTPEPASATGGHVAAIEYLRSDDARAAVHLDGVDFFDTQLQVEPWRDDDQMMRIARTLRVDYLPLGCDTETLKTSVFEPQQLAQDVRRMRLGNGSDPNTNLGYAYVEMTDPTVVGTAIQSLAGTTLEGVALSFSPSRIAISKGKSSRPSFIPIIAKESPRIEQGDLDRRLGSASRRRRSRSDSRGRYRDRSSDRKRTRRD
ncbi:hypothetical protein BC828DRAFT_404230 [Blastocladiella britannica]|nr:hypothetical protein BC828DRAFT_404230 [Blastocladiella britannica]